MCEVEGSVISCKPNFWAYCLWESEARGKKVFERENIKIENKEAVLKKNKVSKFEKKNL